MGVNEQALGVRLLFRRLNPCRLFTVASKDEVKVVPADVHERKAEMGKARINTCRFKLLR